MRPLFVARAFAVGLAGACALASACGIDINGTDSAVDAGGDVGAIDASGTDADGDDAATGDAAHADSAIDAMPSPDGGGDAGVDAIADSGPEADAPCQGFLCGATCIMPGMCGSECPGFPVQCNASRSCIADCSSCTGETIDCTYCPGGVPLQVCILDPGACATATPKCPCADGDAGDCPAANQVCTMMGSGSGVCGTCGDPGTQGKTCGGGGTCAMSSGTCQ
jgi:hypothetical protein